MSRSRSCRSSRAALDQIHLNKTFRRSFDPTRRAVVERLGRGPASVSDLAKHFDIALPDCQLRPEPVAAAGHDDEA